MSALPAARTALQMYTLRELPAGYLDVLRTVAEIGFIGVEPAGLRGTPAAEVRAALDDLGLEACSAHVPLPDAPEARVALEEAAVLGAPAVFSSLHAEWFETKDAVERAADRFQVASAAAAAAGVELGYHNHWWEFATSLDGERAYDAFRDALSRRGLAPPLEIDLYWVRVGGADPAELIASLADSVRYLHVKDGPLDKDLPMTALGTGSVDLPAALSANPSVRWHIVELDRCATDMVQAVRDSYRYLVEGGFSTGRSGGGGR